MPLNKNAYLRYQIIDECLTKPSRKYPSSGEILDKIERVLDKHVSKETLQKDIHHMKHSADLKFFAPIKYSRSNKGYYYEDVGYSIKNFPIKYDEQESAEFALALLKQSGALPYLNKFENFVEKVFTFSKVESKLNKDVKEIVQFEEPTVIEGLQWMELLVDSIQMHQVLKMQYRSIQRMETNSRFVHPYMLKEYDDRWYLFAYDEKTESERIFGLDRIKSIEKADDKNYTFYQGNLKDVFKHTIGISRFVGEPEEILLKFYFPQSEYIITKPLHESQTLVSKDKDSITIKLFVRINYELKAIIRSYGKGVEVLQPDHWFD